MAKLSFHTCIRFIRIPIRVVAINSYRSDGTSRVDVGDGVGRTHRFTLQRDGV